MREIDQVRHLEVESLHSRIDDLRAALEPAAGAVHGIQHQRAVIMKTQPVVGEHRIGLGRLRRVVHGADADAFAAQRLGEAFELRARLGTRPRGTAQVLRTLEGVGSGRLRVVAERVRPNHEYGIRALRVRFPFRPGGALDALRHGSFSHVPKRCGSQARSQGEGGFREEAAPSDSQARSTRNWSPLPVASSRSSAGRVAVRSSGSPDR